ncbi:putative phosphatidylinositol 4-kinase alpha [Trypanosoma cruzi]|uniref:Putative phosphatidylinositol 4-kinase alpha n=1 Tax=Trypanosoma cruzi TaxID=5693 RepID=A0A2V2WW53_TRYCR|nr:putative phosphatidylinositol 4-kinase alpha [Trypanosoma cruzi]
MKMHKSSRSWMKGSPSCVTTVFNHLISTLLSMPKMGWHSSVLVGSCYHTTVLQEKHSCGPKRMRRVLPQKTALPGKGLNSMDWTKCIRLLAASMPPLMHMRSSDYQQTMADIDVLKHRLFSSGDLGDGKFYQKELVRFLQRYCPEAKHVIKRLSFSEAFLINALATLEMLRASCGSISTITQYQHYELREFDASKDIRKIVKHVTKAATARYISALGETLPDFAASIIDKNARQLVLLYGFAIDSVRSSAKESFAILFLAFPPLRQAARPFLSCGR